MRDLAKGDLVLARSNRHTVRALLGALALSAAIWSVAPIAFASTSTTSTIKTITQNWLAFFSGSSSATKKASLLEDGSEFSQLLRQQASSPISETASAKVLSVTIKTSVLAKVRYSVLIGGKVALANQRGQAVFKKGKWLVDKESYCALLSLEGLEAGACSTGGG